MATKTVSFKATDEQVKEIDKEVEEGNYTSRGEFLRDLLREKMEPELTEEAVNRINKARKQLSEGKGKSIEEI